MMNSGFDRNRTILKNRASGYAHDDNNVLINAPYINAPVTFSAGGLYSTVEDMYIWDRALYTEKILKKSSFDKMFTPFKGNYGYGWRIDKILNHECIHHAGGHYGFQANIARYVDDDVCVIILSNMVPIRTRILLKDLTALVFGEKDEQLED
jgi:CubicO group peptidase (beta-lactamase class C family)